MTAYYNEIDPYAAQWLRNLIDAGLIASGIVDERSIEDVEPRELVEFTQCHFFAGIGLWSLALRRAGWPDGRPVWTGSCPCQPFSSAGKGAGFADERHLWPAFHHLIRVCRPVTVFGEQVASNDGLAWLDTVSDDLEGEGYTVGANDLCSAGFGAPNIRQRLYWVADSNSERFQRPSRVSDGWNGEAGATSGSGFGRMADTCGEGLAQRECNGRIQREAVGARQGEAVVCGRDAGQIGRQFRSGPVDGFWRDADWLFCRDGKWRPVEPSTFPLVTGYPARVGKLRAYGNAINPEVAQGFTTARMTMGGAA